MVHYQVISQEFAKSILPTPELDEGQLSLALDEKSGDLKAEISGDIEMGTSLISSAEHRVPHTSGSVALQHDATEARLHDEVFCGFAHLSL